MGKKKVKRKGSRSKRTGRKEMWGRGRREEEKDERDDRASMERKAAIKEGKKREGSRKCRKEKKWKKEAR